jgi:hypothetical protein
MKLTKPMLIILTNIIILPVILSLDLNFQLSGEVKFHFIHNENTGELNVVFKVDYDHFILNIDQRSLYFTITKTTIKKIAKIELPVLDKSPENDLITKIHGMQKYFNIASAGSRLLNYYPKKDLQLGYEEELEGIIKIKKGIKGLKKGVYFVQSEGKCEFILIHPVGNIVTREKELDLGFMKLRRNGQFYRESNLELDNETKKELVESDMMIKQLYVALDIYTVLINFQNFKVEKNELADLSSLKKEILNELCKGDQEAVQKYPHYESIKDRICQTDLKKILRITRRKIN